MNKSDLEKYDTTGMHKIYNKWPQIAKESYQSNHDSLNFGNIDHIVY